MPAGWSRTDKLALALLVLGMLASLPRLVHPFFDAINDAALYILCAKSMLAGEGYAYLGEPFIIRPPGMSVLIAPLIAWRGTDFQALNLYVNLWGVLAVALLFVWTRPRLGALVSAALGAFVWLNPGWRETCNQTMSDVPGIALLLACLLLEGRAPSVRNDILLGIAIGLSSYVRSATVLLVPAILLQRVSAGRDGLSWPRFAARRLLLPALVPFLILLPWELRDALHHPTPPVDQTSLYDYSSGMWNHDRGDPASKRVSLAEIAARIPQRGLETLSVLGSNMRTASRDALPITVGALVLVCGVGFLLLRNRSAGWYVVLSVCVLLVYFSFRERLVLPLWIIALAALAELLLLGLRRVFPRAASGILTACIGLALVPGFDLQPRWSEIERNHELYRSLAAEIRERVPPERRIAAPIASWQYAVYLDRPMWTLFFGWQRAGGMRGAEAIIDKYSIGTVVITPYQDADHKMRGWFEQRYPDREQRGELLLVRVRQ